MEMQIPIEKEIETQAIALRSEALAFQVVDQQSYSLANEFGKRIKAAMKQIDDYCDPVIEAAHQAHKKAVEQKKKFYAPFEEAKKIIDEKQIAWWKAEQERIAIEKRKAEEEARKKAEEERLRQAQELQDAGLTEAAQEALEQPIVIEKVAIDEPIKAGGESYRESWSAEVVDIMALVKAVANGSQPIAYLQPNMTALNSAARTFKGTVQIPGVKIVSSTILARRLA
jgi:hypothetical protein